MQWNSQVICFDKIKNTNMQLIASIFSLKKKKKTFCGKNVVTDFNDSMNLMGEYLIKIMGSVDLLKGC